MSGLARCLQSVGEQADRPDLLLTGGDLIMDALETDEPRIRAQWEAFKGVWADAPDITTRHCLGNHDAWPEAPHCDWSYCQGKKLACDELGLERPYYSFDAGAWRVLVLDSTLVVGHGRYAARLDAAQFEWLEAELAATPKNRHVMIVSHIPILTVTAYFFTESEKNGNWDVPGEWMHTDARRLKDLFYKAGNVRLCLAGHMHMNDRVDYLGTRYICSGAVSGRWWRGHFQECAPGYSLVDLFENGSFERRYVAWCDE
jgi:3',5'-cyclic-AMP phosphodiesterase